jgi:predicted acetyltransferase
MGAAGAAAVIRRKEREVRDDFIRAGATTPANAKSLADLGLDESFAVRRLSNRAVIREAAPGLLYFDEDVWQAVRAMRRRMALLLLGSVLLAAIVLYYTSNAVK